MVSDGRRALLRAHIFKVSTLHQKCINERPSENMDLQGTSLKLQTEKITEKRFSTLPKKTIEGKDSESKKLTFPLQTVRIKLNKT